MQIFQALIIQLRWMFQNMVERRKDGCTLHPLLLLGLININSYIVEMCMKILMDSANIKMQVDRSIIVLH